MRIYLSLISLLVLQMSCSHLEEQASERKLLAEKDWVRSTYKDDMYVAFNKQTGRKIWRFDVENGSPGAVYDSGKLFFGGGNGHVYAVKAFNGDLLWDYAIGVEVVSPPAFHKGTIYVLTGNNVVHAIDAGTGERKWTYNRKDTTTISVNGATQPVIYRNNIIVGFSDGFLASLRQSDGTLVWERHLNLAPRFSDIDSTPVIDGQRIYVAGYDGELYALRAEDGQIDWQVKKGGYAPVTIFGDLLLFSTSGGEVLALEKATGKGKWEFKLQKGIASKVSVYNNIAFFAQSHGPLLGLNILNGEKVFSYAPGRGSLAAPTIEEETGRLYLMSKEGNVHALKVGWRKARHLWPWEEK